MICWAQSFLWVGGGGVGGMRLFVTRCRQVKYSVLWNSCDLLGLSLWWGRGALLGEWEGCRSGEALCDKGRQVIYNILRNSCDFLRLNL